MVALLVNAARLNRSPHVGHPSATVFGTQMIFFFQLWQQEGLLNKLLGRVPSRKAHPGHGQKRWLCVAFVNCFTSVPTTFEIGFNLQNKPLQCFAVIKVFPHTVEPHNSLPATTRPFLIFSVLISTSTKVTQPPGHGAGTKAHVSPPAPPNKA